VLVSKRSLGEAILKHAENMDLKYETDGLDGKLVDFPEVL
jgi:hypothetical protein